MSRSQTDELSQTDQRHQISNGAGQPISERDFMREIEEIDDARRRTHQAFSPGKKGVTFQESLENTSGHTDKALEERMIASVETKERPRADEVMRDLELNLDLSDNVSQTNTTENMTEYN